MGLWHRLSRSLHIPVEELKDRISVEEFNTWALFESVSPDPISRLEYYMANLTCIIANTNRDKKKKPSPFIMKDFLLFNDPDEAKEEGMSKADMLSMKTHIQFALNRSEMKRKKLANKSKIIK